MTPAPALGHPVIELRRYVARPGRRERLASLFDSDLAGAFEQAGAAVLGAYLNLDDPNEFVWLRGFADHSARRPVMDRYYASETWRRLGDEVGATIEQSDNILQLRALNQVGPAALSPLEAAPAAGSTVLTVLALPFDATGEAETGVPDWMPAGHVGETLITDPTPNTMLELPIRTDINALVFLTHYAGQEEALRARDELTAKAASLEASPVPAPSVSLLQPVL